MYSLFKIKFDYYIYLALAIVMRLAFMDISWFSYFAIMVSLHQFILLFNSMGTVIPMRYLLGSFMCIQMLIGPMLAYNGLDQFQQGYMVMQIPEMDYFAYVLPAVICFIFGLHVRAGMLKGEVVDIDKIQSFVNRNKDMPYYFIGIGFVASLTSGFFASEIGFLFYLLGSFKFIGAFLIILGNKKLKPMYLIIVYGSIISSSLGSAMFHDLLTWLIFTGAVFSIKYKPSVKVKAIFLSSFMVLVLFIQLLKGDYRTATWVEGQESGIETLTKTYETSQKKEGFFNMEKLGKSNVRINQGFIITNIMNTVPKKVPFSEGTELMQILEAAIMPRFLAPNKLNAGDREIFMRYSGMPLSRGTSMGLSSVGDAYINFGILGGCIFMFIYGFVFSEVLNAFHKYSKAYPVLILFTALAFYYPIRPDCELQTILGHLVKACFVIFVVIKIWEYKFLHQPDRHTEKVISYN